MPKQNSKNHSELPRKGSELSAFVEESLPSDSDVSRFDEYLKEPARRKNLSDSLSKIYEDDDGQRVNVQEVNIRRQRSLLLRFGFAALYLIIAIALIGTVYYFITNRGRDVTAFDFSASAPTGLKTNQDFSYVLDYHNRENTTASDLEAVAVYPENFVFIESTPAPSEGNNKWRLADLPAQSSGQIRISGRIIGQPGQSNIMFADLTYRPSGITSTFKKSTSLDTVLSSSGVTLEASAPGSALVGQEQVLTVTYAPEDPNYLDRFLIRLQKNDNIQLSTTELPDSIVAVESGLWQIDLSKSAKPLQIKFKFKDRNVDSEDIKLSFEYAPQKDGASFRFDEKIFPIEIIKNTLNLTVSANAVTADQGVDFAQPIAYSISYANKGEATMSDVIIMAVLSGDALDWHAINDPNKGKVTGSTIIWTKDEIPALRSLVKGQEGRIDFTIPVRGLNEAKLISGFEISSYAQFALGDKPEELTSENQENRSNQLTLKVNSNLALEESARYFDPDNIAVGTGPLPPQVGQRTSVKVYWKVTNNLHEVGDVVVTTKLPDYVTWDGKEQTAAGTIAYDPEANTVTWTIGRMPLTVNELSAEFSIALQPRASDRNKLMILVTGTSMTAMDIQTAYPIKEILKSQTTQLEKDEIANSDGIVR